MKYIKSIILLYFLFGQLIAQDPIYFDMQLSGTGNFQTFVFNESIVNLNIGDEIAIFDYHGISLNSNCNDETSKTLVGSGVWMGTQLSISAIGSINQCSWNDTLMNGFVGGNMVSVHIWDSNNNTEFIANVNSNSENITFDNLTTDVYSIDLVEPYWNVQDETFSYSSTMTGVVFIDNSIVGSENDMLAAFGNYNSQVDSEIRGVSYGQEVALSLSPYFGEYVFALNIYSNWHSYEYIHFKYWDYSNQILYDIHENIEFISNNSLGDEMSPVELHNVVIGCMDQNACNYNFYANSDDESCVFPETGFCDCNGNTDDCLGICGGSATIDSCGVCDGDGIPDGYCDCEGNILDDCNICGGTGSLTYYQDIDGDGWGSGAPVNYCNGEVPQGWVSNNNDVDDNIYCISNIYDDCQNCDGDGYIENCICSSGDCINSCSDMDCQGTCNGSAIIDDCFYCVEGTTEFEFNFAMDVCSTCEGTIEDVQFCTPPIEFENEQSTQQGFYYIINVMMDGNPVDSDDWVGIFNNDLCVGARAWNTSSCGGGVCEVPAMGDDGSDDTEGYLTYGDLPAFKIYDSSENIYYDATPNINYEWSNFGQFFIDSLEVILTDCNDDNYLNSTDNPAFIDDCGNCVGGETPYEENWSMDDCGICAGTNTDDGSGFIIGEDAGCDGICFSNEVLDDCGICGGNGLLTWYLDDDNDGLGDPSITVEDCNMPLGYTDNQIDIDDNCPCEENDNSCYDCLGNCGTNAYYDDCQVCDNNINNDNLPNTGICDCLGVPNGSAIEDECGICNGDNSDIDCNGICYNVLVDQLDYVRVREDEHCYQYMLFSEAKNIIESSNINEGDWIEISDLEINDEFEGEYEVNNISSVSNFVRLTVSLDSYGLNGEGCGASNSGISQSSIITLKKIESYLDDCGHCVGANGLIENYALDDCNICNGGNYIDDMGFISGPNAGCDGVCGSDSAFDQCYVCDGDGTSCLDCLGVANGSAYIDNCGICVAENDNSCIQACDGNWYNNNYYPILDECGICGGSGPSGECGCEDITEGACDCEGNTFDECGICNGPGSIYECGCTSISENACNCEGQIDMGCGCGEPGPSGCDNVCGSSLEYDECGICGGDNSDCEDCNGIPNGSNLLDNCGICDDNPENDCMQDCEGSWGGTAEYDECGVCNGPGFPDNSCDCEGNILDECGICGGNGPESNYDCDGNCIVEIDCNGICGGSSVLDLNNQCCDYLELDNCEICNGNNESDLGCGCFLDAPQSYWIDEDGDGLGSGESVLFCLEDLPENWVNNNDDEFPYCFDNYYDCLNNCGGNAEHDYCSVCEGQNLCLIPILESPEDSLLVNMLEVDLMSDELIFLWSDTSLINIDTLNIQYEFKISGENSLLVLDSLVNNVSEISIPYHSFDIVYGRLNTYHWYLDVLINNDTLSTSANVLFLDALELNILSGHIPQNYKLYANYPNPFNPKTLIRYGIANPAQVGIKIYDVNGREVDMIMNTYLKAGYYETHWDASRFSSGIYIAEIIVKDNHSRPIWKDNRKMLLIK